MAARKRRSYARRKATFFEQRWIRVAITVFVVELLILALFSMAPLSSSQQTSLLSQYSTLESSITNKSFIYQLLFIAPHNMLIAAIDEIPILGLAFFGYSITQTAMFLNAYAVSINQPGIVLVLALFFLPHTILELPAYALAVTENLFLSYALFKGGFRKELRRAGVVLGIIIIELLVAGSFESAELQLSTYAALLLWIPFIILISSLLFFLLRRTRTSQKRRVR